MKMNNRTIIGLRAQNRGLIYEGLHYSISEALHDAQENKIDLDHIDFNGQTLSDLNLDGIKLKNANFSHCDLSGCNLSEADLQECNFKGAKLFDACLCYTKFKNCDFRNAKFGSTDIAASCFYDCQFEGPDFLGLDITTTGQFQNNVFSFENTSLLMRQTPITLNGFKQRIAFFDSTVMIGSELFDYEQTAIMYLLSSLYMNLSQRIGAREG